MTRYVVKNERGEYLRLDMDGAYSWGPKRRERMVWMSDVRAHERAKEHGGKVYRLRKRSAKRERKQAVGYLRALGGTKMFTSPREALLAAANEIESGEHLAWRAPKESK